ncbi:AMP-binding protein [Uliginosibacterium gangwonense]|uniref:AMP-binding protein n=1 Tax=Uliginosibacterium gangwonense TaxID=392736 RepID=UPI000375CF80|nr:AMP-binding protein [Uliginosibacterium gangwonense]
MNALPLLPDASSDIIVAVHKGRLITRAEFLGEALALAAQLPAHTPVLNLCADRYHFAIGLFACIARGTLSLLPNALTREIIAGLHRQHPALHCLSDQGDNPFDLPMIIVQAQGAQVPPCLEAPLIPAEQLVAQVFTSGSTGTPQAHAKRWGSLTINCIAEAQRLWEGAGGPCTVVGTVPFQHMYGLESTVLMPLLGGGVLCAQRPFYPGDIAETLAELLEPRMLVTTPVHLRTLLDAELPVPPLALVLSATAPLADALAERAERELGAPLHEIYGATETGQLASRRTCSREPWRTLGTIRLRQADGVTLASGGHIEVESPLNDIVELVDAHNFRLVGRNSDMINIGGKRSSLAFLNHILTSLPGVRDGVFCLPDPDSEKARLAAFVVAPQLATEDILQALRSHIDAVFLPRPIIFVDSLPRNSTGKITQDALQTLITTHLRNAQH